MSLSIIGTFTLSTRRLPLPPPSNYRFCLLFSTERDFKMMFYAHCFLIFSYFHFTFIPTNDQLFSLTLLNSRAAGDLVTIAYTLEHFFFNLKFRLFPEYLSDQHQGIPVLGFLDLFISLSDPLPWELCPAA